jgi:hypothetical protein
MSGPRQCSARQAGPVCRRCCLIKPGHTLAGHGKGLFVGIGLAFDVLRQLGEDVYAVHPGCCHGSMASMPAAMAQQRMPDGRAASEKSASTGLSTQIAGACVDGPCHSSITRVVSSPTQMTAIVLG